MSSARTPAPVSSVQASSSIIQRCVTSIGTANGVTPARTGARRRNDAVFPLPGILASRERDDGEQRECERSARNQRARDVETPRQHERNVELGPSGTKNENVRTAKPPRGRRNRAPGRSGPTTWQLRHQQRQREDHLRPGSPPGSPPRPATRILNMGVRVARARGWRHRYVQLLRPLRRAW